MYQRESFGYYSYIFIEINALIVRCGWKGISLHLIYC
ncbi:hypothetical protein [Bartonella sp. AR 15-3]|nr:hypothetical protein [Bartonella sp. AR 15-3]